MKITTLITFIIIFLVLPVFGQTDSLNVLWSPNSEPDMFQYNLHRSINDDPFTLRSSIPHPTTYYIDHGTVSCNMYSYYLTAEDLMGNISLPSNTVSVGIPQVIFVLDSLESNQDHQFQLIDLFYDQDSPLDSLTPVSQNEANVIVQFDATNMILTPSPIDYQGNASFDLAVYDEMGFWDIAYINFIWYLDAQPPSQPTGLLVVAFPNPFTGETTILYALPEDLNITIEVYDTLSRKIDTLVDNQQKTAGKHYVKFKTPTSGQYFYRLTTSNGREMIGKMTSIN